MRTVRWDTFQILRDSQTQKISAHSVNGKLTVNVWTEKNEFQVTVHSRRKER